MSDSIDCVVLRCARQDEMYIYLRADLDEDAIPQALRQRTGALTPVMELRLDSARRLARVDVNEVIARLRRDGLYLQMPPQLGASLHFGD